jgi:hypothetical protein
MKHLFLDVRVCAVNAVSERTNELMKGREYKSAALFTVRYCEEVRMALLPRCRV